MEHRRWFSSHDVSQPSKLAFSYDVKYRLNVELLIYVGISDSASPCHSFYLAENFHVNSLEMTISFFSCYGLILNKSKYVIKNS